MAIQQKLQTRLAQKLILTPSLQQAIKLLPMSTLELADLLNQEVVENPMLEEVQTEELQPADGAAPDKSDIGPEQGPQKSDAWEDSDYAYFFGDYLDDGYRPKTPTEVKELPPIENTLSTTTSLADHLRWQLSLQAVDETMREIGVAARDLQECLWLQLRHLGQEGTPAEQIVTEHLRLLQNHQVPEIARKLGLSIDELKQHIELIRHLDPKPGSRDNPNAPPYVDPDVLLGQGRNNER